MLISLTVTNFGPFRDPAEFWMVPFPKLTQHKERLASFRKYRSKALTCAALFGPNASGKSSLVTSLRFIRCAVLEGPAGPGRTGREPFALAPESAAAPSRFALSLFAAGTLYDYEFELSDGAVLTESLRRILTKTEEIIFQRNAQTFTGKLFSDEDARNIAYSTGSDTLLLRRLIAEGVPQAAPLGQWFRALRILSPETGFAPRRISRVQPSSGPLLKALGTGIESFRTESAYLDGLPREERERLIGLLYSAPGEFYEVTLEDGSRLTARLESGSHRIEVTRLTPLHSAAPQPVQLDARRESLGARRLCWLIPELSALLRNPASGILVIDDLDLGLHPLLTRKILSDFLSARDGSHMTQLIFTTRSTELLDQSLFRRDELWFTERSDDGSCQLRPLTSFVSPSGKYIRFDKIIRRDYLKGLFGAIPRVADGNIFQGDQS
ncbi:MAG: ATP-binding protein [Duodenibacillus sp.]|nr:ATP-binding protein [Duodenibacillus sp.]